MDFGEHVWTQFQEAIAKRLTPNKYATWIEPLIYVRREENRLVVKAPEHIFIYILTKTYGDVVRAVFYEIGHQEMEFQFMVEGE